ncbi:carboxypeptidase-like regulatory domain-containing protein [Pseudobacteroides cellulosolvens]|uniref:Uncharacterized protein n=1 Tax=Pseudobacteroides cellulosolvens ATCC 35603 = DSM 2933 TaxID=398512 RepID=A0A0L6JG57_9FIRM|nr:carboxypeptidase-like regulatory domain-containing protein [Pseudobacteroides cellulosolvens]KNY24846.1 hypothetical protein Bccel_0103 [Pseudobacteroides cellulosolvens ATCC 35603 = DSM 2933]
MAQGDILLGEGVFSIGGVDIALVRGGGSFVIEREYRPIEADGDYGPVKGRIRKTKSVAKLALKALELLPANLPKFYPAMNLNTSDTAKDVLTAAADVSATDYNTVSFTGRNLEGKQVYIEVKDAINLENINWELVDKEEVISELNYTGTYDPAARTTEPWKVEFAKGTTYTVTFTVTSNGSAAISGASVTFNNRTLTTNASGVATFAGVSVGTNKPFSVTKGGYKLYQGAVDVDSAESVAVTMTVI